MTKKRCKIHYRKLDRSNNIFPASSFSEAISAALEHKLKSGERVRSRVSNRVTSAPSQTEHRRFLNNFFREDNIVFGDICLFAPGEMQALLELEKEEEQVSLEGVLKAWSIAEKSAPDGMEYLHGITYWMAVDDHFYQIQHSALTARAAEEYFTWLLREQTGLINSNQYVALQAAFDRRQLGADLGDIKAIEIGGLVPETVRDVEAAAAPQGKTIEVETHHTIGDRLARGFHAAKRILVDLLGDVEAQKIIDSTPPEAALEVKVSIGYKATKRKFQKEFMQNLADGLKDLPDGQIRVRGRDGEIKGQDARLSTDMSIKKFHNNGSLLDPQDAFDQMKEVHRRFLHDGLILA